MLPEPVYRVLLLCGAVVCLLSHPIEADTCESDGELDDKPQDRHHVHRYNHAPRRVQLPRRPKSRMSNLDIEVQDRLPLIDDTSERASRHSDIQYRCGGSSLRGSSKSEVTGDLSRLKSHRVAGGYAAEPGQFPSYVFLTLERGHRTGVCGGTIIGPSHILTAAHCVENAASPDRLTAQPVTYALEINKHRSYTAEKICVSPKYSQHARLPRYDVAIVKLTKPIIFTENVQPACLPSAKLGSEDQAYAVGMGLTRKRPDRYPDVLQVLPVKQFPCIADNHHSVICFRSNQEKYQGDTCSGDSGGPVYAKTNGAWTIYGAVSYGPIECSAGIPGVGAYANVSDFSSDIAQLARECSGKSHKGLGSSF